MIMRLILSILLLLGGLVACTTSPPPAITLTPPQTWHEAALTPELGDPVAWREPSTPITLDNIESIALLGRLESQSVNSTIFNYALSPDYTQVVALNNTLVLSWDLVTGGLIFSTSRQEAIYVYYSPNKDEVYTITAAGDVYFLKSEDGTYTEGVSGHDAFNSVLTYVPDEGLLALGGSDGSIHVWDLPTRTHRATLANTGGQPIGMRFSDDAQQIVATYTDSSVLMWDWQNETLLNVMQPPSEIVRDVQFSQDARLIVGMADRLGFIWDAETGNLHHTLNIEAAGSAFFFEMLPPSYAVTAGLPKNTSIWDVLEGKRIAILPDVGGNDLDIAFSPDGLMMFSTVYQQGVTLWNLLNIEKGAIGQFNQAFENDEILNIAWTPDSFLVLMFDARGVIEVWGIP